jgi:hypothetical protein
MKKGLVLALALLTVFAFVSCDSSTDDPGKEPGDEYFVPPADWVGFSDAEYAAGIFYIGYGGEQPETTSITKKGSGFEVKIKTLTTSTARQSVLSLNFETAIFQKGHYVSLTLPTAGGNARPTDIIVYPMLEGTTNASGGSGVAWSASSSANVVGEQAAATFDGKYVVGDLKMDWRNAEAATNLTGISLWFQWDEDVTLENNDKDYVFTINTIKVNKSGEKEPPPPAAKPSYPFDLGEFTWVNNENQKGWRANGTDTTETDLPVELLIGAKALVLELDSLPNQETQVTWQGNGTPGWAWNNTIIITEAGEIVEGTGTTVTANGDGYILKVEFSKAWAAKDYQGFLNSTQAKILVQYAYGNGGIPVMGLQKAYLVGDIDLGTEFTISNGPTQQGWGSNGTDDIVVDITVDGFKYAKFLVLELSKAPIGGLQVIWQGDGDNWNWNENQSVLGNNGEPNAEKGSSIIPGEGSAVTLRLDLTKAILKYDTAYQTSTKIKILLGYYSNTVADLGITKAYLEL